MSLRCRDYESSYEDDVMTTSPRSRGRTNTFENPGFAHACLLAGEHIVGLQYKDFIAGAEDSSTACSGVLRAFFDIRDDVVATKLPMIYESHNNTNRCYTIVRPLAPVECRMDISDRAERDFLSVCACELPCPRCRASHPASLGK